MPTLLDSVDAVFLDIGSTLVMGPPVSPNKEIVNHFGLSGDGAAAIGRMVMCTNFSGPEDVCRTLRQQGVSVGPVDSEFISKLWSDQEAGAKPIEGALQAAEFLKISGKKLGLLSDIWSPYYRAFTRACPGIDALVEVRVLSFEAGLKKPDAAFFELAIAKCGVPPTRTLMVGDTYDRDIEPAMTAGMKAAWVLSRPEREVPALVGVIQGQFSKPDITVASIGDLQSATTKENALADYGH